MRMLNEIKNRYGSLSIQAKASLWFVLCSVLQRGIAFVTVPIFTRLMTTEQYGYYSNYISWFSIILVFTSLSLYYGVFNNAMMKYEDNRVQYVSSMQGLVFTITFFVFIIYLIFHEFFNAILKMPTSLVLVMFVELMLLPSMQFWTAYNRFYYNYKKIVAVTMCEYILNSLLGIILVLCLDDKAWARIISIVIVECFICGFITIVQFNRGKVFFHKEYWGFALSFNIPLLPHYLSGQILSQSDRVMINYYSGYSAVAMYSVAYNIGILLNIFVTSINGSYTPWFYQSLKEKNTNKIREITSIITIIVFVLVVCLMLVGPEIIAIVASSDYSSAVYVIPPVAASVYFTFIYNLFANVEFYFENKKYVMYSSMMAAILNVILNYFFIKLFGYIAAAYTTLFCYSVYAFLHFCFAERSRKSNGIDETLFDVRVISLLALLTYCMMFASLFLYSHFFVRWIVIIFIFISFVSFRKSLYKNLKLVLDIRGHGSRFN